MVYITKNLSIDFLWTTHVNKDSRFNPYTQEEKETLKQAPENQTISCIKSGQKQHACKEKHACKDVQKTWAPQFSPYAAPTFVAFLSSGSLKLWGFGARQMLSITLWPSTSCKKWISRGYRGTEAWQKPEARTEQRQC